MILNEKTYLLYAAKYYDNPNCIDEEEFLNDLARIQYIKRLLNKYIEYGELKERLILNHMTILYNCFGVAATDMLLFKLKGYHEYILPFIEMLNYLPETVSYDNKIVSTKNVIVDKKIKEELSKI